jgi:hypothetical protein
MGLGALPQASRLNLGKFRGSRTSELDKVLRPKKNLSSSEVQFKVPTCDSPKQQRSEETKKSCCVSLHDWRLRLENDEGGFPLLSYKWCEIILCPNGLLLLDFWLLFIKKK